MAKGSEVGSRVKLLEEFGPCAQLGAAQAGGWRAGSGREIRKGRECFGNWKWYRPEPDNQKEKGAVSGFEFKFVYLQTQYVKEFSHVVPRTMCAASLSNVLHHLFFFPLQVTDIRLAVGRIRIEKLSLACRKTQSYSCTVWQHTKDGTIKDLVLSSALCCLSFSFQSLFITLKSLCKTENKAVLAHFSISKKVTSSRTWPLIKPFFPTTAAVAQNTASNVSEQSTQNRVAHEFDEYKCVVNEIM